MSKYLAIRSIDRIVGTSSTSFQIQLKEAMPNIRIIRLLSFIAPNTLFKIRTGINNQFVWNRNSTNYNYAIPPASYTIYTLLNIIQTAMNTQDSGNNYTLSYDTDNMMATIQGTSAFVLNWFSSPYGATSCYRELGFPQVDTVSATSQTSSNCISLERPTRLYITIRELMQSGINSNMNFFTFMIPITVASGNLIIYQNEYFPQTIQLVSPINLTTLTFTVSIENNELANFNGGEWELLLELS